MLLGTLFYHVFNIIKVTDVRQEMSLLSLAFFHSYIKGKSTTSVQAKKVTNYGVPLQLMQMDTISKGNMDIVIQKNVKKVILKIKVATAISTTSMGRNHTGNGYQYETQNYKTENLPLRNPKIRSKN